MEVTPLVGGAVSPDLQRVMKEKEATDDEGWEKAEEKDEGGEGEWMRRCLGGQTGGFVDHEALWPHHLCLTNLKMTEIEGVTIKY